MNIGTNWGTWAIAVAALFVGLLLLVRSRRNKKWNWVAAGVLALLIAVGMFVKGWTVWPKQTAEHFISVVSQSRYDEAQELLNEPQQLNVSDDGTLDIRAEDGTKVTLAPDELPLVAGGRKTPVSMRSSGEVLAAKNEFTVATGRKRTCIVHCIAERGKVRIRHVEAQDSIDKREVAQPNAKAPPDLAPVPPGRLFPLDWESRILERLMGGEARVYQFAGTFMECWLEYETSDGLSERSETVRIDAAPFVANGYRNLDLKHLQGWVVVRGDLHRQLDLHLTTEVQITETGKLGWITPISHLDLPKPVTNARREGWAHLGTMPHNLVELPDEVGSDFTVFSNTFKETTREADVEKVVREVTVRLKSRLLPADQ